MIGLKKTAEAHLALFKKYLEEAGNEVIVRQPAPRPTAVGNDVSKVLGARPVPTSLRGTETLVMAIVSGPANVAGTPPTSYTGPAQVNPLGKVAQCDLVLRVLLSDVLVNSKQKHGKTLFDTALDIQVDGGVFKVEAMERGGLAPLGPYILWVGLMAQGY
jgi:hypothetical protein